MKNIKDFLNICEKSSDTIKTRKAIVAFIDILGTRERLKCDKDGSFLRNIQKTIFASKLLPYTGCNMQMNKINIRSFSDNICCFLVFDDFHSNSNEKEEIASIFFLAYLIGLQTLTLVKNKCLLRGFVTIGDICYDDNFIIGNSLIRAYEEESNSVETPRIVVDSKHCNEIIIKNSSNDTDLLIRDIDGEFFLNYLAKPVVLNSHKNILEEMFINAKDIRSLEKIMMLILYHNRMCEILNMEENKKINYIELSKLKISKF